MPQKRLTPVARTLRVNGTEAEHTDWNAGLNTRYLYLNRPSRHVSIGSRNCCDRNHSG